MIASLTGRLTSKAPEELILDVSGVGYLVQTTLGTYEKLPDEGKEVTLHIYTYVREDQISLFGFFTRDEKVIFVKLLKVNGIGPKLALAILSGVGPHDLVAAVTGEDLARLNAIPGVGRKTAERIIVDLKDKLLKTTLTTTAGALQKRTSSTYDDALSALLNLGYKRAHAEKALGNIGAGKDANLSTVIKDALKELAN